MHQRLLEVTTELVSAQDDLLRAYDPVRLYNFRVASRRIRSILKQIGSHHSRLLHKAWGGLFAVTGGARDWDVFLATSQALLTADDQKEFESINRERVANVHKNVIKMLKSSLWKRHLREWHAYLEHAEETVPPAEQVREAIERALFKVRRRFLTARDDGSDRNWHRYRIAIKELRYVTEAHPDTPGAACLVEACKSQQTLLGDWHDTVVQLNLLEELPPAAVHDRMAAAIRNRQAELLSALSHLPPIDQPEV